MTFQPLKPPDEWYIFLIIFPLNHIYIFSVFFANKVENKSCSKEFRGQLKIEANIFQYLGSFLIQKQSSDHKTEATPSSDTPKRPGSVGMGGKKFWFMVRLNRSKFSEMVKGHDRRDKFRSSHRSPGQCNSQSRSSNNRYTLPGLKDPGWLG